MNAWQNTGRSLKAAREAAGLSLRDLARLCAEDGTPIGASALCMIESGQNNPTVRTLETLARVLRVTVTFGPSGVSVSDAIADRLRDLGYMAQVLRRQDGRGLISPERLVIAGFVWQPGDVIPIQLEQQAEPGQLDNCHEVTLAEVEAEERALRGEADEELRSGTGDDFDGRVLRGAMEFAARHVARETAIPQTTKVGTTRAREAKPRKTTRRSSRSSRGSPGRSTSADPDLACPRCGGDVVLVRGIRTCAACWADTVAALERRQT